MQRIRLRTSWQTRRFFGLAKLMLSKLLALAPAVISLALGNGNLGWGMKPWYIGFTILKRFFHMAFPPPPKDDSLRSFYCIIGQQFSMGPSHFCMSYEQRHDLPFVLYSLSKNVGK